MTATLREELLSFLEDIAMECACIDGMHEFHDRAHALMRKLQEAQ